MQVESAVLENQNEVSAYENQHLTLVSMRAARGAPWPVYLAIRSSGLGHGRRYYPLPNQHHGLDLWNESNRPVSRACRHERLRL